MFVKVKDGNKEADRERDKRRGGEAARWITLTKSDPEI